MHAAAGVLNKRGGCRSAGVLWPALPPLTCRFAPHRSLPLQPVHAQRSKGLRGGASPLLLPGRPWRRGSGGGTGACSLLEPRQLPSGSSQLEQLMPSEEVLERSEFLLPLDAETSQLYRRLLQA